MAISDGRIAADRFDEYSGELREFSHTYRIPYGKPEDLAKVLETFRTSEEFAADFGSMIRSVMFREQCQAAESELLTLIAVTWGGRPSEETKDQLPPLLGELRSVLQEVVQGGPAAPNPIATEDLEEPAKTSLEVDDTIRELERISPDVEMYRQLLKLQESQGTAFSLDQDASAQAHTETDQISHDRSFSPSKASIEEETSTRPVPALFYKSVGIEEGAPPPDRVSRATEVIVMGLIGLVAALLINIGAVPVYRTRVSVLLTPAAAADGTSPEAANRIRQLTDVVAERLLALPHPDPILKQDAISRGMRDFHLGQSEPILFADLVDETAHNVKIRPLQSNNLYEITCDSWSAQFAATFCQALTDALDEQALSGELPATFLRTVDAVIGPGVQIYPQWYLLGGIGLTIGCLGGLWLAFSRPKSRDASEEGTP